MKSIMTVMGGSFNPPTRAHLRLMISAMDAVNADMGVFAPTGSEYVARKMKKQRHPEDALSDDMRLNMLESFASYDSRIAVSRVQMCPASAGFDYEMLESISTDYPDMEIYFITGSDKLFVLPRWHRAGELLDRFHVLVARREEDDIDYIRTIRPTIDQRWDRFTVFDTPGDIAFISSSAFRDRLRAGDLSARELVTKEVWDIMSANGKLPDDAITDFHDERYLFLSNFCEARVVYAGLTYLNSEAAFQAQKCMTEEEKIPFTAFGPGKSKAAGRRVRLRPDWEEVKVSIMEEIVRAKFAQNPDIASLLIATGDRPLVEGNTWGDRFWGVDMRTGQGENHLGKILMKVREELSSRAENRA